MIHRDDVDYELAEEITKETKKLFPGMKLSFAGDDPECSNKCKDDLDEFEILSRRSMVEGRCLYCEKKIENWILGESDLPEGWEFYQDIADEKKGHFECPECYSKMGGDE